MVIGCEQPFGCRIVFELLACAESLPEFVRSREAIKLPFLAGEKVELDDAMPVGRIGEFQSEDFGIVLGLLQPVARCLYAALASTTAIMKSRV